eukprot:8487843-Heterocapsa_arctica.AAC.1
MTDQTPSSSSMRMLGTSDYRSLGCEGPTAEGARRGDARGEEACRGGRAGGVHDAGGAEAAAWCPKGASLYVSLMAH